MMREVVLIIVLMVAGLFAFSSCDPSTHTELAESFDSVKEVSPVPGGQDVTMNLEKEGNLDSFFTVSLDGSSEVEGWCIEWNEHASFGLNSGTNLYSTKGKDAWKGLNYFMKIKDDLRAKDPELKYQDIQVIIWSLIDKPVFDVDKIDEYENLSGRIYYNGNPYFNVQKVKDIVSQVKQSISEGVQVETGVILIENDGQTVMIGDETAFAVKTKSVGGEKAVDRDYSTCFDEEIIENVSFANWGWTNGPISENSGEIKYDIYAGAGQCDLSKGTLVGELTVKYSGGTFTATYKMTETSPYSGKTYTMTETHLWVGSEPYPTQNGKYTVAPGHYGNVDDHDHITEFTYEITGLSGPVYFIAHAVVSGFHP
ncbi:hypothetical protein NC796_03805 [Aliifodinibius sp. S!AR15-10]|uniref:hypothetical protein n=1 Tax=Aliifodinibius sp. S!AR15-10 TaxID=2950437 RepID=UPI0028593FBC|nr:hypothetical protein [Aliifodinibius sp. S!AR15-10]MDR8390251.1 hypothetical protein [Aliifodinibius sp. S!AR15-10]